LLASGYLFVYYSKKKLFKLIIQKSYTYYIKNKSVSLVQ